MLDANFNDGFPAILNWSDVGDCNKFDDGVFLDEQ